MGFPENRARRLRKSENIRRLVREAKLSIDDLMYPIFVVSGKNKKEEIEAMPGIFHFSTDKLGEEIKEITELKIPGILIFGVPDKKDKNGEGAYSENGIVQQAVREIKKINPELVVATDVCLCSYTESGHCGLLSGDTIDNDKTIEVLAKTALTHAKAGADIVAPSDMMDGRVKAIRGLLEKEGYKDTIIMSYAAKYASGYYGPFREAAHCAPSSGDRKAYQMDPANSNEALKEIELDIAEEADIIMVKPALA